MRYKNSTTSLINKRLFRVSVGLLIVLAIAILALELTDTTHLFHKKVVPPIIPVSHSTVSEQKKPASTSSSSNGSDTTDNQGSKLVPPSGSPGSTATLIQPYGELVSNHFPGQNGSDTKESSACNSTPGATCYIQFTNTENGKVTKLPPQLIGNDGSTVWSWDAKTLTQGTWQITAVADLNGQTKNITDTAKLEIQ